MNFRAGMARVDSMRTTMVRSTPTVGAQDQAVADRVLRTFLRPRAQPAQLQQRLRSITLCHAELRLLGFRLVEKREHYGGPRLPTGQPMSPILIWQQGCVLVRIKPRGEAAVKEHRAGLAHMSVSLVDGRRGPDGALDTSFEAEVGKFAANGRLVAKAPGPVMSAVPEWLQKPAGESWADATHFLFPDLTCDDSGIDRLVPT